MRPKVLLLGLISLIPPATRSADTDSATGFFAPPSPSSPPLVMPPAPPAEFPPSPQKPLIINVPANGQAGVQAEEQRQTPAGQWVYTQQYGWVWMPYGDEYTSVPPDGYGEPYEYVYYTAYGWTWVDAPWVWGIGPWPYFGVYGPSLFGWYGHGWWRSPWRWHYAGWHGHGWGPDRHGNRGSPYRSGFAMDGAPAWRGGAHAIAGRPTGGGHSGGGHR